MRIRKASGELEDFKAEKLRRSLQRSGASPALRERILKHVKSELYEGMTTQEIYTHALGLLKKTRSAAAYRYHLKQAVMNLGPSGYPFEDLVAAVLSSDGYQTKVRQLVPGKCLKHEVDIIAQKKGEGYLVETKFHNKPGIKEDIQTALYVYARFLDIKEAHETLPFTQDGAVFHQAWLVTNTKVTAAVKTYGECVGLRVVSWDYPENFCLRRLLEKSKIKIEKLITETERPR